VPLARGAGRYAGGSLFLWRREDRVQKPDDQRCPNRRADEGLDHAGPKDVRLDREDRDYRGGVQQHGGRERGPACHPFAHLKTNEEQQPECSHQNQQPVREDSGDSEGCTGRSRNHGDQRRRLTRAWPPGHADEDLRSEHGCKSG
jgi:hypothetical protein